MRCRSISTTASPFVPTAKSDRVDGKEAILAIMREYSATTKKTSSRTNITPEEMRVNVYGETGVVTFNVRSESAVSRRTFIFHRRGDRWLITHFHASNIKL